MIPTPGDLGLPAFATWRRHQPDAILSIVDTDRRFVGSVLPTGAGKTLTVAGAALLMDWRTAFLTSTKLLQEQYARDLAPVGLRDVRGQGSYRCVAFDDEHRALRERAWQGCDEGPCRVGYACARKPERDERDVLKGCESYDAIAYALRSKLVTTNYKMWLHSYANGQGLGRFDCLVLDEAHHADKELADFLSTVLDPGDLQLLGSSGAGDDIAAWSFWAKGQLAKVKGWLEERPRSKADVRKYRHAKKLAAKLETLKTMDPADWVVQEHRGGWHFDVVWVEKYAGELFRDIPRVVLTSATITRNSLKHLGIADRDLLWHEAPSDFPVERRPVYYVPCVKLDYRADESQVRLWLATVDNFLRRRRDRKGIIHAVSYARARQIVQYSEFARDMIIHDTHSTREKVEQFKAAGPGAILVSPSVTTGYDFPYTQCEFQVIAKIPFPDRRSPVVAARTQHDPRYPAQIAAQEIMQAVGRGMRAADDLCETVLLDNNASWFMARNRDLFASWFMAAYRRVETLPEPPAGLQARIVEAA